MNPIIPIATAGIVVKIPFKSNCLKIVETRTVIGATNDS
jgi:hypothetical protein